ncbi:MAG: sugar transferase [Candidatus Latescibacterota bacterium]
MKRVFDIVAASLLLLVMAVPMLVIALIIRLTSRGPAIHVTDRIGINNTHFNMYKFRTMKMGTPQVATHLLPTGIEYHTRVGKVLRPFAADEWPQLINILKGDMSVVGPRPALFNQYDLVELRMKEGIDGMVPGLTGWAQIRGSTYMPISDKVSLDKYYLDHQSFLFDLKIMIMTASLVAGIVWNAFCRRLQVIVQRLAGERSDSGCGVQRDDGVSER